MAAAAAAKKCTGCCCRDCEVAKWNRELRDSFGNEKGCRACFDFMARNAPKPNVKCANCYHYCKPEKCVSCCERHPNVVECPDVGAPLAELFAVMMELRDARWLVVEAEKDRADARIKYDTIHAQREAQVTLLIRKREKLSNDLKILLPQC